MADGAAAIAEPTTVETSGGVAADRLRSFIERVERLEEDKKAIMEDMKEVYAEAKGEGYDTKVMRQIVRIRKMDRAERQEQEAILELYLSALGEAWLRTDCESTPGSVSAATKLQRCKWRAFS